MKLQEWITTHQQQFNNLKNNYPIYFEYVENRYKNFELLYEAETFNSLLLAFVIENHTELKKIELIKNTEITKNDLVISVVMIIILFILIYLKKIHVVIYQIRILNQVVKGHLQQMLIFKLFYGN